MNTVISATSSAMVWMTWIPVAPFPMTPTRLPANSIPSLGQREVCTSRPAKSDCPGNRSLIGADNMPQQVIRNWVSMVSPESVVISQRLASSSKTALVMVVLNWMSRRRSRASAT